MTSARWVGVGRSAAADSGTAGAVARADALSGRADARLLIVFASPDHDLEAVLAGVAPGDVPLVGCSSVGEITSHGPAERSVVVLALGGPAFSVCTRVATDASSDLRAAGADVARCVGTVADRPHRTLLLLSDGLSGNQQEIVRGAYDVAGAAIPLVGGCASDDLARKRTFVFHGGRVLRDAVVGVALGSDAPLGIGVQHGWRRAGDPVLVTRAVGNRVYTLDDRPALDVYLERQGAPDAGPDEFTRLTLTHPLGLGRRSGEDYARFVRGADFEERSLECVAAVPQGALAWFLEGDVESVLAATDGACEQAVSALGGAEPLGVIAFDCIARRSVLGPAVEEEVARIGAVCGGAPVAGFYTYGEIARTRGVSGFHNQTLVVLAVA